MTAKDIIGYQMKPGETLNPNGRPKGTISELRGQGLNKTECYAAIAMMLKYERPQLKEVSESNSEPIWKVCIARAILKDISRGYYATVETLFDRLFGRAKQEIEHQGNKELPIEHKIEVTTQEARELIKKLNNINIPETIETKINDIE